MLSLIARQPDNTLAWEVLSLTSATHWLRLSISRVLGAFAT